MNEEQKYDPNELTGNIPEIQDKAMKDPPKSGPGYVNIAIPDRGHIGRCLAMEFDNAGQYNAYCAEHPNWLTVFFGCKANSIVVVFNEIKSDITKEEILAMNNYAEEKRQEFVKAREEREAALAKAEQDIKQRDEGLRAIGRLCIEKHGAFHDNLPMLSTLKNVRKNVADDILKLFNEAYGGDAASEELWAEKLTKVLNKYVKDGVK